MPTKQSNSPLVSVIITAHNEGDELNQTLASIRANSRAKQEILLVDEASSDGCCAQVNLPEVRLIRHASRIGVAYSRDEACRLAQGEAYAFLDGHQRLSTGCLEQCAALAIERDAVVWPDVCGYASDERMHGAYFVLCRKRGYFSAEPKGRKPSRPVARISSLSAPGYVIPRAIYPRLRWSRSLRGWGGSEAAISLKAFFTGTNILHLCGPVAWHQFKSKFHYNVSWPEVWRNHALIARICFSERTWRDYWLPEVFRPHLSEEVRAELDSDGIRAEHDEFQQIKIRTDREFWTDLVFQNPPATVR